MENHQFVGDVKIEKMWVSALVVIESNLKLHVLLPISDPSKKESPEAVEGNIAGWNIKTEGLSGPVSFQPDYYYTLEKNLQIDIQDSPFQENDYEKTWWDISFFPAICRFSTTELESNIPDEWGITFYPERNNHILFHLFNNNSFSAGALPNIFSNVDRSLYFENKQNWTEKSIQERLGLITSSLQLFVGSPLDYALLISRTNKEVSCVQFHVIGRPNSFTCPSQFNGHADIIKDEITHFSARFTEHIEALFKNPHQENITILLKYYRVLYMTMYSEFKVAFSFQLMEALARCKGQKIINSRRKEIIEKLIKHFAGKMCSGCIGLLEEKIDHEETGIDSFIEYVDEALKTICSENQLKVDPSVVKEIARRYRNEVFHGDFFQDMSDTIKLLESLPLGYREDFPFLLQAIVSIIGVHLFFGIPFEKLNAVKRKLE